MSNNCKYLLLGIGATALSDTGAGLKSIRYILRQYPDITTIANIYHGRLDRNFVSKLEQTENLIVFDTTVLNHKPGTVTCLVDNKMDIFLSQPRRTAFETALANLMQLTMHKEKKTMRRALIAIEPKKTGWGNRLSNPVSKAIPEAVQQAIGLLCEWSGIEPSALIRN